MKDLKGGRIIDLIPECLRSDPRVTALSDAFGWMTDLITDLAANEIIYPAIDKQDADVLDFLAIVLRTQQYDQSYSLTKKRELIKGTFKWYMHAGTVQSVQELCDAVFGSGTEVKEWFDMDPNDGYDTKPAPFLFDIKTETELSSDIFARFESSIMNVKNVRSLLRRVYIERSNLETEKFAGAIEKSSARYQIVCDLTPFE